MITFLFVWCSQFFWASGWVGFKLLVFFFEKTIWLDLTYINLFYWHYFSFYLLINLFWYFESLKKTFFWYFDRYFWRIWNIVQSYHNYVLKKEKRNYKIPILRGMKHLYSTLMIHVEMVSTHVISWVRLRISQPKKIELGWKISGPTFAHSKTKVIDS